MAVYPSRIRLKNSIDSGTSIASQIGTGGSDPILAGEVVIGRESGAAKLYTLDSTGAVVAIGSGSAGASALSDLTDVNVTGKQVDDVIKWNGTDWVATGWADSVAAADGVFSGTLAQYPLNGIDGWYASESALTAAGFTMISGSTDADDSQYYFTPGSAWNGINFLNLGISSANWFINPNGAVGCDAVGYTTGARSGNALTDGANIDLYVAFWAEDSETRRAGWKVYNDGSYNWLIVRMDFKVPYNNESAGFPVEVWFRQDGGAVSVRYGSSIGGASFTTGTNRNVIVSNGTNAVAGGNPFPGVTGSGNYGFLAIQTGTAATGAVIGELYDVDTTTNLPSSGQVLGWDGSNWIPVNQIGYRNTSTATTSSIASGSNADITLSGTGKSGSLISVTTDRAAWVVLYSSTAARTADASRTSTTDPTPGSGVLAEVLTSGAQTVKITPVAGYLNDETVPTTVLYAKVKNLSGATSTVQVSIAFVVGES
jgi:hypothetical protein